MPSSRATDLVSRADWNRQRTQVLSAISRWRITSVRSLPIVEHALALAELAHDLFGRVSVSLHGGMSSRPARWTVDSHRRTTSRGPVSTDCNGTVTTYIELGSPWETPSSRASALAKSSSRSPSAFAGFRFPPEVITVAALVPALWPVVARCRGADG